MIVSSLQNFVGSSAKKAAGSLGSSVLSAINCDQGVLNSVLGKVDYLHQAIDRATSFINMFSLLNNEIPTDVNVNVTIDTDIDTEIEYARNEIEDGVDFIRENYGDKFTMTDASGLLYNLYLKEDEWVDEGHHYKSLIKTSVRNDVKDCLLYYKDGKLRFNQIIRSANFSMPEFSQLAEDNILYKVGLYCAQQKVNFNGTWNSIPGSGTIYDRLVTLRASGDTINDMLSSIITTETGYRGKLKLWWDVLRDFIQSTELNANILEVVQAISNGVDGVSSFMASLAVRVNNAMSCLKKFFIDLSNAFAQGGFKGVVYFIYNFFKNGASMVDDNGLLAFTNNSLLVPRQYIAGIIPIIATVVATVVSTIASIINPVIGAIFAGAGALLYGAFKSVTFDQDATRCGIQTSDRVLVPAFPFALIQDEFTPSKYILNLLNDYPILLFEVPGGYVLMGPGSYDSDKNIVTARMEFHPASVKKLSENYFDIILSNSTSTYEDVIDPRYKIVVNFTTSDADRVMLEKDWASGCDILDVNNSSNDRLNMLDECKITELATFNTFTFLYWMECVYRGDGYTVTGKYTLEQTIGVVDLCHPFNKIIDTEFRSAENWEKMLILTAPFQTLEYTGFYDGTLMNKTFRGCAAASWDTISGKFKDYAQCNVNVGLYPYIIFGKDGVNHYYGDPIIAPNNFDWAVVPAKYDGSTFLTWIIISTLVVAVTAVVAVVSTFKIKRAIQNKRAEMNKMVDNAWTDYTKGNIDYNQYRKTVKKANRWQTIIGGTRYDYENYWNGDQSADGANNTISADPNSVNSVSTTCTDLINKIYNPEESKSSDIGQLSIEDIKMLISGC